MTDVHPLTANSLHMLVRPAATSAQRRVQVATYSVSLRGLCFDEITGQMLSIGGS
jgi:hypothetical protein